MSDQDLLKHLRMRPYSNPSYWMLEAADEIERLRALLDGYEAMEKAMKQEATKAGLLSRARDAEDLDCPSREFGPSCQSELIRELADEIERLQSAYDGLTPAQYHAGVSRLLAALGNPEMDGRDVFTRVADEITALRAVITAKLHRRRCHDCGYVGWYVDSRTPYCLCDRCCSWLCDRCRSWDTRLVKEEK